MLVYQCALTARKRENNIYPILRMNRLLVSVSVGPDDCVYVVEYGSNRVSIFDKSFSKKGDKDGEFDRPYTIAVSDEGYVYVSDTHNDRIQVFK